MNDPQYSSVTFRSESAGVGPLMWGQRAIHEVLRWLPPDDDSLNQVAWCPVAAPLTLSQVVHRLRCLMERHDSLRTRYPEREGEPVQQVAASGEVELPVFEIGDEELHAAATAIGRRIRRGAFDIGADLPVRPAVATRAGVPVAVVLGASHMAVDGWSFHIVMDELRALLAGGDDAADLLGPPSRQPLQRARFEASEAGLRREGRTLDYWARQLREVPAVMLGNVSTPDQLDRDWARIDSAALATAAYALSARSGSNPATVLLSSIALLLSLRTGEPQAALRVIVSTRFKPEDQELVGAFNQNAFVRLTVEDESVEQYLARSARTALNAYRHSEACALKMEEQVEAIARERGIAPGGYLFFNDTRYGAADRNTPPPTGAGDVAAELERALTGTVISELDLDGRQSGAKFFVFLDALAESCVLTLCTDPRFHAVVNSAGFLADLERLMVRAAIHPDTRVAELADLIQRTPEGASSD